MTFTHKPACEEFYQDNQLPKEETTTFITDNLIIVATHFEGQLLGAVGKKVKTKQIEMNHVEVEYQGAVETLELGENVRWLECEL